MEDSFRNTLLIISAVVIGAIFVHGLWTIRKNKNPYKLKADNAKIEPVSEEVDKSGFDQYGVGQPKVAGQSAAASQQNAAVKSAAHEPQVNTEQAAAPTAPVAEQMQIETPAAEPEPFYANEEAPDIAPIAGSDLAPEHVEPALGNIDDIEEITPAVPGQGGTTKTLLSEAEQEMLEPVEIEKPVYQTPVSQPKPQVQRAVQKEVKQATSEAKPKGEAIEQEVLVLSVVMPQNQLISGAALLPSLLTLGMKFGDMGIFHRHQDNAGNGKVTFSLANMMNPGTFDLDNMESFATQGVSLFMTLPNEGDAFEVFEQMLSAAKQLATEFNGQVLDDKRSVMTKQTEQHYISNIREFERKRCIAGA
ncbi:cell division protein ZipA [Thalassomonas actiniarum]|uniref:Cell division protein ZipA n=1 Tax=Thalassomonas actiniarum TaxID=485447 RepID=A0AAE9YVQ3_9GAMM|nr:cell division protein ZipA [Thalassomonas actiniarum]WDE01220.1 cell division protein ZipA [Thalassomonas actiniarum]